MSADRKEVQRMKQQFRGMKDNIQNEMKTVKQVVTMLFDLQSLDQ